MAFNVQPLQISQPQAYSGGVDWSPLAKLGEQYKEGVKQDQLADLGKKLADGSINYKQAAGLAADMGNPDAMLKFLALQQQQDELGATNTAVNNAAGVVGGPGAAPAASAARTINPPPSAMPAPASPLAVNPAASAPVTEPAAAPVSRVAAAAAPSPQNAPIATPQGPVGYPASDDEARTNITRLSGVLNNRSLPKTSQDILNKHLEANFKYLAENEPAEVRTLRALVADPALMAAEIQRRKASKPETNVNTAGETAEAKARGEAVVDVHKAVAKEWGNARAQKAQIEQLGDLGSQFDTGGSAAVRAKLASLGIKVGKDVGKVEAYGALIDKMTPGERIPGSGSTSDFDAKQFKAGLPQLVNTPEGNAIIRGTHLALSDDKIKQAEISRRYLTNRITAEQAFEEAQNLPDPFARYKAWKGEQEKKPASSFNDRFGASGWGAAKVVK